MKIFINTDDPKKVFKVVKNVLTEKDLKTVSVSYRDFNSQEYIVIWPESFSGEFGV